MTPEEEALMKLAASNPGGPGSAPVTASNPNGMIMPAYGTPAIGSEAYLKMFKPADATPAPAQPPELAPIAQGSVPAIPNLPAAPSPAGAMPAGAMPAGAQPGPSSVLNGTPHPGPGISTADALASLPKAPAATATPIPGGKAGVISPYGTGDIFPNDMGDNLQIAGGLIGEYKPPQYSGGGSGGGSGGSGGSYQPSTHAAGQPMTPLSASVTGDMTGQTVGVGPTLFPNGSGGVNFSDSPAGGAGGAAAGGAAGGFSLGGAESLIGNTQNPTFNPPKPGEAGGTSGGAAAAPGSQASSTSPTTPVPPKSQFDEAGIADFLASLDEPAAGTSSAAGGSTGTAGGAAGSTNPAVSAENTKLLEDLAAEYQASNDKANAANQARLDKQEAGYTAREKQALDLLAQVTDQDKVDTNRRFNQSAATAEQDLISRGLGNTTVRSAVMRGNETARNESLNRLSDARTLRQIELQTGLQQDGLLANERVNDVGADQSSLIDLAAAIGQGSYSPVASKTAASTPSATGDPNDAKWAEILGQLQTQPEKLSQLQALLQSSMFGNYTPARLA